MTGHDGPSPVVADLRELSLSLNSSASFVGVVVNWLQNLSATQGAWPTTCAGRVYLAAQLELLLNEGGWPLSDLASGHVLAFATSDIEPYWEELTAHHLSVCELLDEYQNPQTI